MQPGDLRDRVGFYAPFKSKDGAGNNTSGFADRPAFQTVSANIKPKLAGELVLAQRLTGVNFANITVRQSSDTRSVTTSWKVRDERKSLDYNIRSIIDPDQGTSNAGTWLEMLCETGVAS